MGARTWALGRRLQRWVGLAGGTRSLSVWPGPPEKGTFEQSPEGGRGLAGRRGSQAEALPRGLTEEQGTWAARREWAGGSGPPACGAGDEGA